ncbi:MAG TPA: anti-sigma factor [Casimicrobiaceae bacterium]|nr:anti-sigma factor [Casimicrobiaceae bacterium]
MSVSPISDADLHAYADGQLDRARLAEVEAALARDPSLALQVDEIRRQNALLRQATEAWLEEPIPQRLIDAATAKAGGWQRVRPALPYAAAAAMLVVGMSIGWFARDAQLERTGTPTTFARQAALTHVLYATDVNRPVEVWAAEEKRLATWLTRRLGFAVHAPDLNSAGFALVGGRLVAGNEKPTALFMYEDGAKHRLTLQVRKQAEGTRETAFRYAVEDGVGVFYWIDDACGYALSGNFDRAQLLSIARLVYGQLAAAEVTAK